ncbi:MAG: hypothetical protein JNJ45_07075 [Chthonomonas sp.]|nr:hypothetical protein [Chthonomonas sp.]
MYHFVYIRIDGFYFPQAEETPRVLLHDDLVLAACPLAQEAGIRLGMTTREARTLLRMPLAFRVYSASDFEEARNLWLNRCLTCVDRLEPILAHEALLDFSGHPDPAGPALELYETLRRAGYRAVIGMGSSPWVARRCAQLMPDYDRLAWQLQWEEAIRHPRRFLESCPIMECEPLERKARERLLFLGYPTLRDVDTVPAAVLRRQLGMAYSTYVAAREGGPWQSLRTSYPDQRIMAAFEFPGGCSEEATLQGIARRLSERLVTQLQQRDETSSELVLELEWEDGQRQEICRPFAKPLSGQAMLYRAITLTLPPAHQALVRLQVELRGLEKKGQAQPRLDGLPDRKEAQAAAHMALNTLKKALGDTVVQRAGELPRPRRVQVLQAWNFGPGRSARV